MKKWILLLLTVFIFISCKKQVGGDFIDGSTEENNGSGTGNPLFDAKTYKEKSKAVFDNINKFYGIPGSNFFLENYPKGSKDPRASYFWSHSTLFTGAIHLKSLGYTDASIQKVLDGMNSYWDVSRTPVGFQSAVGIYGGGDRFYDDNAIAAIDDILAYKVTNSQSFLNRAEAALAFSMSGESTDHGGGLFWSEQYRHNDPNNRFAMKATNSSALAATAALQLYQINNKQEYLDFALRMYNWVKTKMQDPVDKAYWNDIQLATGVIETRKWTYNSGAMISNAVLLYQITGESKYLDDAKVDAQASYNYFAKEISGLGRFFPTNDPWFTVVLLRGYLDLYEVDQNATYINTMIANLDHAWKSARNQNGFFLEDWTGRTRGREQWIINQTGIVEAYALISKFKNEK